ncbi:MAG: MarR family transcriptional regulator [Firmicutes bacterium]|jgi:hypothetical protein|nr:MarR family transcriptional regulator [Clostridia bacterium]MBS6464770.1 MarR family transcriptional regulator [Bacillota bacterium]
MLDESFEKIYRAFRLEYYKHFFSVLRERAGSLSAAEISSVEVIYLLNEPTMKEFADYIDISPPNATYKVKSLVEKGYLKKIPTEDGREFRLRVTDQFRRYYSDDASYGKFILSKMQERLSPEEIGEVSKIIALLDEKVFQGD